MFFSKTLFLLSIACWSAIIVRAQDRPALSGKVTDSATGKPIAGCSVYLNNTSIGTVTATDGVFLLKGISRGRSDLVVSAIGYTTYVLPLRGDSLPGELKVRLRQNATELSAFTVESWMKDGWKQWGKFFLDNFIGTTGNASSCTLVNRKVLRFHYSKKNRRLTVSATAPLIIHNKALGYDLQYQLEHFSFEENTEIVFYQGYPLFREMTTQRDELHQQWMERRKKAYLGSMHHFIQSLYKGWLPEQGFLLEHTVKIPNVEKQRVKLVYDPNAPIGAYSRDSLYYYWNILKQGDSFSEVQRVDPNNVVTTLPGGQKSLMFNGHLFVKYFYQRPPIADYWQSDLLLQDASGVEIEENGSYFPPENMLAAGSWAQTEKICNLLPLDYPMPAGPPAHNQ